MEVLLRDSLNCNFELKGGFSCILLDFTKEKENNKDLLFIKDILSFCEKTKIKVDYNFIYTLFNALNKNNNDFNEEIRKIIITVSDYDSFRPIKYAETNHEELYKFMSNKFEVPIDFIYNFNGNENHPMFYYNEDYKVFLLDCTRLNKKAIMWIQTNYSLDPYNYSSIFINRHPLKNIKNASKGKIVYNKLKLYEDIICLSDFSAEGEIKFFKDDKIFDDSLDDCVIFYIFGSVFSCDILTNEKIVNDSIKRIFKKYMTSGFISLIEDSSYNPFKYGEGSSLEIINGMIYLAIINDYDETKSIFLRVQYSEANYKFIKDSLSL